MSDNIASSTGIHIQKKLASANITLRVVTSILSFFPVFVEFWKGSSIWRLDQAQGLDQTKIISSLFPYCLQGALFIMIAIALLSGKAILMPIAAVPIVLYNIYRFLRVLPVLGAYLHVPELSSSLLNPSSHFQKASFLLFTLIAVIYIVASDKKIGKLAKQMWFVPACLNLLSVITAVFNDKSSLPFFLTKPSRIFLTPRNFVGFWGSVLPPVILLLSLYCLTVPSSKKKNMAQETSYSTTPGTTYTYTPTAEEGYCGMAKHILLMLFTFGVWICIWIYRTTRFLNCVKDEEQRSPTNQLLLCMFVPFYQIYWTYKSTQRIDKLAAQKGISSDITTLCLILNFFLAIVPPIIMQDKMNAIVTAKVPAAPYTPQQAYTAAATAPAQAYTAPAPTYVAAAPVAQTTYTHAATPAPQPPTAPNLSELERIEIIKGYKELLDIGAITQEEFDAKKKQMMPGLNNSAQVQKTVFVKPSVAVEDESLPMI